MVNTVRNVFSKKSPDEPPDSMFPDWPVQYMSKEINNFELLFVLLNRRRKRNLKENFREWPKTI